MCLKTALSSRRSWFWSLRTISRWLASVRGTRARRGDGFGGVKDVRRSVSFGQMRDGIFEIHGAWGRVEWWFLWGRIRRKCLGGNVSETSTMEAECGTRHWSSGWEEWKDSVDEMERKLVGKDGMKVALLKMERQLFTHYLTKTPEIFLLISKAVRSIDSGGSGEGCGYSDEHWRRDMVVKWIHGRAGEMTARGIFGRHLMIWRWVRKKSQPVSLWSQKGPRNTHEQSHWQAQIVNFASWRRPPELFASSTQI